jgi:hypothetical protein
MGSWDLFNLSPFILKTNMLLATVAVRIENYGLKYAQFICSNSNVYLYIAMSI